MRLFAQTAALAATLALAGCATMGSSGSMRASNPVDYCKERPEICAIIGAAVVGGVILVASHHDDDVPPAPSDARLKTDLGVVETLPNGIALHAFRYLGSSAVFVGAMAQDLLADARFSPRGRGVCHQASTRSTTTPSG